MKGSEACLRAEALRRASVRCEALGDRQESHLTGRSHDSPLPLTPTRLTSASSVEPSSSQACASRSVNRLTYYTLTLALLVPVLGGCPPAKVQIQTFPSAEKYRVKTVVIIPFEALSTPQLADPGTLEVPAPGGAKRSDISVTVPPLSDRGDRATITVPAYAAEKVANIVYRKLKKWEGIRVLSPDDGAKAIKDLGAATKLLPPEVVARLVAERLSADAVLLGKVLVYQERVGSKLGADPAAVGFEVKLVAADGETLWVGNYYEKQRPMNEDLLGFVQRWGFVTAEELAEYGAEQVLQKFPFGGPSPRHA